MSLNVLNDICSLCVFGDLFASFVSIVSVQYIRVTLQKNNIRLNYSIV